MFPYNDEKLMTIKEIFSRQFMADIMFDIGAIVYYAKENSNKLEIDWKAISSIDCQMLINLSEEMLVKLSDFKFSTSEKCQAGRLFAYYILGKENKKSDEYISLSDLKRMYELFLAFSPMNITYSDLDGVVINGN